MGVKARYLTQSSAQRQVVALTPSPWPAPSAGVSSHQDPNDAEPASVLLGRIRVNQPDSPNCMTKYAQ